MNPQAIRLIALALSMKQEIKIIAATVLVICLLPILSVVMLSQAGFNIVSGALVSRDTQSTQVDIHDPGTGEIVDHVDASVIWPIPGTVTLEFGDHSPYQWFHTGIDIAGPIGDPVAAFMKGKVIYADTVDWGFGRHVKIDHGHFVTSIYAHLDTINVKVGDEVEPGTIIGTRGNTGWSTGPHTHFQINVFGIPVNPRVFLDGNPPN
jgi:murein DD-endopeptidase MepM/ murein hydrolase activator NlpD